MAAEPPTGTAVPASAAGETGLAVLGGAGGAARPPGGRAVMTAPAPGGSASPGDRPVAVATGANRGIGREVARQLAAAGYRVVLGSRDPAKGERAARDLDPGGEDVTACCLDVSDDASAGAMAAWVGDRFGRADTLVNNAAIMYDGGACAVSADLGRVHEALEKNLFRAWRAAQALLPLVRRSPHPRIVNVSSEGGSISEMTGGTPPTASPRRR